MNRIRYHHLAFGIALALCCFVSAGCTTLPQADSQNFKDAKTQNNAVLNHVQVTPTSFVSRTDLSQLIIRDVPEVETAEVLEREGRIFVGVTLQTPDDSHTAGMTQRPKNGAKDNRPLVPKRTASPKPLTNSVKQQVAAVVHKMIPHAKAIYVTNDETLTYHFHMFTGDQATGRPTSSDLVLHDINRVFPSYS
ncbi:YhcN/YlaJ family sporulation lipoprotein [Sulfoacidibacillus thermotolerans]|uniref:Sporulation protein n=1 Tax=Sulfoacidibacillus thermotolerans TaxID=1765684 RepID=A0A2U3D977_SULT2|nr:YhcN/YlaJ family sporulation lipoprotein [Sulfoacidibacillus thermotolerans]PWI57815.1 hypothetical protein BM613_06380 [Sulfoacidibacillus thermotolerans]